MAEELREFKLRNGKTFKAPKGTPPAVINATARRLMADEPIPTREPTTLESVNTAITDNPVGRVASEFGAGIGRGAAQAADFFTTGPVNAALEMAGSDTRIPTIEDTLSPATVGGFMEPGLGRDVVRTAGELVPAAAATGATLRGAAQRIPEAVQTVGQGVTRQLGQSTAAQDVTGAVLSGAGMQVGGEVGEAIGGETGRAVGELAGAIAFPVAGAVIGQTGKSLVTKGAKKLLTETAPTIDGLKTAARGVYKEIDDLGAVINSRRVTRLSNELRNIAQREGFDRDIHPKVAAALKRFDEIKGLDQSITEVDTLRKIMAGASKSLEPDEKRLGSMLINKIDDTLDNIKISDLSVKQKSNISINGALKTFDDPQTGSTFKTGEPVSFNFVRNTQAAPRMDGFQQNIEPAGRYMSPTSGRLSIPEGFEGGSITMKSPLVVKWNTVDGGGYDATGWKARLSDAFGGSTGKKLSQKIVDAGYDGVVTIDIRAGGRSSTSEVVDLSSFKQSKNAVPFAAKQKQLTSDIGAKYKDARQLWRRAKKSELIEEAFEKARNQASGFENGIRVQFRSILNNKNKSRGFTAEELQAMRQVVRGGPAENIAKAIGKFGFSEGQATSMLLGSLGVAGGAAVGGPAGAVAVPLVGQVSKSLAQKLTRNNAQAANLIVRAGKEGDEIVKAYLKMTRPAERSAQELTELLLRPEVNLNRLSGRLGALPKESRKLITDAVFFADFVQSQKEEE